MLTRGAPWLPLEAPLARIHWVCSEEPIARSASAGDVTFVPDSLNGQLPLELGDTGGHLPLIQALAPALVMGRAVGQNLQQLVVIAQRPASS